MDDPELKLLSSLVLRRCSIVFFPHFDFIFSAPLKGGIPELLENSTLKQTFPDTKIHFLTGNDLHFFHLWTHILLIIMQVNINNSKNFNAFSLNIASNRALHEANRKRKLSVMLQEQYLSTYTHHAF